METQLDTMLNQHFTVELKITPWLLIVYTMVIQTLMRMLSLHGLEKFTSNYRQPGLKKDWNLVRSLESASLYSQHSAQLEDYIQSQTTNVLERVYVENVRIKDFYENPDGNDTLVVYPFIYFERLCHRR